MRAQPRKYRRLPAFFYAPYTSELKKKFALIVTHFLYSLQRIRAWQIPREKGENPEKIAKKRYEIFSVFSIPIMKNSYLLLLKTNIVKKTTAVTEEPNMLPKN